MQVMAMIGDQLDYGDTVCGAVLSIRFGEDILSVWNRNSSDNQVQSQKIYYIIVLG
jgi:translation initiation factor 4E